MTRKQIAQTLHTHGHTRTEISKLLNAPTSTVSAWLDPHHAEKTKRLRQRYQGSCLTCGNPTDGSHGKAKAPTHCRQCSLEISRQAKHWTAERVIDSIQRFAAKHGRPPRANEWIRSNPTHGYPARSSVYRSTSKSTAPFVSWNDAIQAAGFTPTPVGCYQRTPETRRRLSEALRRAKNPMSSAASG